MKKLNLIYGVILFLFYFIESEAQANIKIGDQAPEIHIDQWIANKPSKKSLKNMYIVLDFWATWCKPCLEAVPHINQLQRDFGDNNVIFLSMTEESKRVASKVFDRVDFQTPVVTDKKRKTHINFGDGRKGLAYYPMTVLIDDENVIRWYGESENLTDEMMVDFLNKKNFRAPQLSMNGQHNVKRGVEYYNNRKFDMNLWSDMFMDPNISRITYIEEVQGGEKKRKPDVSMGNGAYFEETSLKFLFRSLFANKGVVIPNSLLDKTYNFYYLDKELDSDSDDRLIKEIMSQLNLKDEVRIEKSISLEIGVENKDLMMRGKKRSEKIEHDIGGQKVFKRNTLSELANVLSSRTDFLWTYRGRDQIRYFFIVDMTSTESIKSSLECYGIAVKEKERPVETIYISIKPE